MSTYYVDVDMVVPELRSSKGQLSVQGAAREELKALKLTSRVLVEEGPAGGNPVVRIYGSKTAIRHWLTVNHYEVDLYRIRPRVHRTDWTAGGATP